MQRALARNMLGMVQGWQGGAGAGAVWARKGQCSQGLSGSQEPGHSGLSHCPKNWDFNLSKTSAFDNAVTQSHISDCYVEKGLWASDSE